ncbi:MAG: aromatic amino acid ammonia-lyase [Pseudomonadota bacterium]
MQHNSKPTAEQICLDRHITLAAADAVMQGHLKVILHPVAKERCEAAHARLQDAIADHALIYGLTTGFGPLANRLVSQTHGQQLQQNLVHHLASGIGPAFDWVCARGLVLARLMSILQGVSGASAQAITALVAVLNSDLSPVIPSQGTVGASGDLTPLAHMTLALQGRGQFQRRDGQVLDAAEALEHLQLPPLDLTRRDGLALVNGTSAMTGVAVRTAALAGRTAHWAEALSAVLAEVLQGRAEAWSTVFGAVRPHAGQQVTLQHLQTALSGSARVITAPLAQRKLAPDTQTTEATAGQDAYTLRCVPQVIGAVRDTLSWHDSIVGTELCAATDNPIFPAGADAAALHGGNFMGQHVGLASDALSNALTVLAGLAERQIARLTDERLNGGLPAFLHEGTPGLNSGLMGAQVTATALLAEMRSVGAASIHSISTNGANQDVVSMGTIAARHAYAKVQTLAQVQAILAITVAQAMDIIGPDNGFSPQAQSLHLFVRAYSARLNTDRPLGAEISAMAQALQSQNPGVVNQNASTMPHPLSDHDKADHTP